MPTSSPRRRPASANGKTSETTTLEATLIATVAPVMRHLLAHARRRRTWSELTYQQYNVLRMIDTMGPQGQAEVARRLMVTAPVVTRLATALSEAGLLERRPDPRDGRAVLLALTPKGRRRARAMRRDLVAAAGELLEPIPAERRDAVEAALNELQVLLPQQHETRHSTRR
jgi:DNA-binding MarR family transcriptional regulator